jgi:hypothetical protein
VGARIASLRSPRDPPPIITRAAGTQRGRGRGVTHVSPGDGGPVVAPGVHLVLLTPPSPHPAHPHARSRVTATFSSFPHPQHAPQAPHRSHRPYQQPQHQPTHQTTPTPRYPRPTALRIPPKQPRTTPTRPRPAHSQPRPRADTAPILPHGKTARPKASKQAHTQSTRVTA